MDTMERFVAPGGSGMQTRNLKIPSFWRFGKNVMGLRESISSYVKRLPIPLPDKPELFEFGCGVGVIGLSFLERWPEAHLVATESDARMLLMAARAAQKKHILPERFELGEADMNNPQIITFLNKEEPTRLKPESFDLVITSTALERADLEASLPVLLRLLKPGGYFLNLGVRDNILGKLIGFFYRFAVIPEETLRNALALNRYANVEEIPFRFDEFPASVLFKGIIARKPS